MIIETATQQTNTSKLKTPTLTAILFSTAATTIGCSTTTHESSNDQTEIREERAQEAIVRKAIVQSSPLCPSTPSIAQKPEEQYRAIKPNTAIRVSDSPVSTFSIDVDTAIYELTLVDAKKPWSEPLRYSHPYEKNPNSQNTPR